MKQGMLAGWGVQAAITAVAGGFYDKGAVHKIFRATADKDAQMLWAG